MCDAIYMQQQASSQLPATDIVRTWRNSTACTYNCACALCVCLVIHTYTTILVTPQIEDRIVPRISVIFLLRTHHAARCWHINTAEATAWLDFHYQPRQYSCPAFLTWKASRMVHAARRSVCLSNIMQDTIKFYYIISKLDNKYVAEVEDVINNPHSQAIIRELKQKSLQPLSLVCRRKVTLSWLSNISH